MNNPSSSNKKNAIIVIVVLILVIGGWYFYKNGGSSPSSSALVPSPSDASQSAIGADVFSILNSVSSIRIDASFFNSSVYQSLVDYSIAVPSQSVGRPNPFAPTGH